MTTLRVVLDELAATPFGGPSRYAGELTRGLLATAPAGAELIGIVPSSPPADYDRIIAQLPGLTGLEKSALTRRDLARLWRRGLARTRGTGMIHATGPLAPLGHHDRVNRPTDQVAVTIHDAIAWSHPELLPARDVEWRRAMARRAERFADAIVVPSHAVALELTEHLDLGDRVRVVPGAPSGALIPSDDTGIVDALDLPDDYVLTLADTSAKKNLSPLVSSLTRLDPGMCLVIVSSQPEAVTELVAELGVDDERVHALGPLSDQQLGVVFQRARAYVQPSLAEGNGLAVIEALGFGLPIVHTDVPALEEITAGAAIVVPLDDPGFAARLASEIEAAADSRSRELSTAAGDRARAFSWRDSAARVWQLHADL